MEEVPRKDQHEWSGKNLMTGYSNGADFEYVPCTESKGMTPTAEMKGLVRSEIHHADLSRAVISPSVQDEAHRR